MPGGIPPGVRRGGCPNLPRYGTSRRQPPLADASRATGDDTGKLSLRRLWPRRCTGSPGNRFGRPTGVGHGSVPLLRLDALFCGVGDNPGRGRKPCHAGQSCRRVGDQGRETVNAALGNDQLPLNGVWVEPPAVSPPDECPPRLVPEMFRNTILDKIEIRVAKGLPLGEMAGTPGDPDSALWARCPMISLPRPPPWPSSVTTYRAAHRSLWGANRWVVAWTTPCEWLG